MSDSALPTAPVDLTTVVADMGLRGTVTSGGYGQVVVTSDAGDKLELGAFVVDGRMVGIGVSVTPHETGRDGLFEQDFGAVRHGVLDAGNARATVRAALLAAGMAEAARGRFAADVDPGVSKLRLEARAVVGAGRPATDLGYGVSWALIGEVDSEEYMAWAEDDRLSVRISDLEPDDVPDDVRRRIGADLCARLGIDPGDDSERAVIDDLEALQEKAAQSQIYRRFLG